MLQAADFARAARMGVTIVQNPSHFMIAPLLQPRLGAERASRGSIASRRRSPPACRSRSAPTAR